MPNLSRRRFRITMITLIIIVNTVVVLYVGRDRFNLPNWIVQPLTVIEGLFIDEALQNLAFEEHPVKPEVKHLEHIQTNPVVQAQTKNNEKHNGVDLAVVDSECIIDMPTTQKKNIYTWVAADGTRHLSDKPRLIKGDTPVRIAGVIEPEAISINYVGNSVSQAIRHQINAEVIASKEVFEKITPANLIKPISVNFRLFLQQDKYDTYQQRIAPKMVSTSGFYMGKLNESVVMMKEQNQGIKTAVHEAMHSINRHWFGRMSKWLNEGIAEYAETHQLEADMQVHWVAYIKRHKAMPLTSLFEITGNNWLTHRKSMYASSWAFVAYLMENDRPTLTRLLMAESSNGCDRLHLEDIERISSRSISQLQLQFDRWLAGL